MHPALDLLLRKSLDAPLDVKGKVVVDLIVENAIHPDSKVIALLHKLETLLYGKERLRQTITTSLMKDSTLDEKKVNDIFSKVVEEIVMYENAATIQDFLCSMARTEWKYEVKPMEIVPSIPPTPSAPIAS